MSAPRVAVCVPAFAAERFLAEALDSVLTQTEGAWEMVIIDDASPDATFEIAQRYAAADPRIRAFRNPENLGAAATWSAAVAATTAPYVKVLCSDDAIRADCLARQLAVFDADRDGRLGLVAAQRQLVAEDGSVILKRHGLMAIKHSTTEVTHGELVKWVLRSGTNPLGEPPSVMFRRAALDAAGGFNSRWRYMLDVALYIEIAKEYDIGLIHEPLGMFRVSSTSWSAQLARSQAAEARQLFREAAADAGVSRWLLYRAIVTARVLQTVRRFVSVGTRLRSRLHGSGHAGHRDRLVVHEPPAEPPRQRERRAALDDETDVPRESS